MHLHLRPFFTEQAIDANNGGIYVGSIRKYSVNDLRDFNVANFLQKKKYWITGLIITFLLVATGIVVPISIIQGVPTSFGQPNWAGLGGWFMVVWVGGP